MLNIVVLGFPVYFLLIGIELLIQQFTHRQIYRLNDAITNISSGITTLTAYFTFTIRSIPVLTATTGYFLISTIWLLHFSHLAKIIKT